MTSTRIAVVLACLGVFGCGQGKLTDPTTSVSSDDKLMNQAIAEARQTAAEFIHELQNPAKDESDFAVKVKITDNGKIEHFWLTDISLVDGVFSGKGGLSGECEEICTLAKEKWKNCGGVCVS